MRIALVQMNAVVGDIAGNEALVRARLQEARGAGAQLVLFPELALTGYPPEDLLLKEHFLRDARAALDRVAAEVQGDRRGRRVPRARRRRLQRRGGAAPTARSQAIYRKIHLPNYGVFDEVRYFQPGPGAGARRGRRRAGRADRSARTSGSRGRR